MLRASGAYEEVPTVKVSETLDKYAKELYEWMDVNKSSRIRMMMHWQGAGGLPYVASVHHRATHCFRYHGNSKHDIGTITPGITLEEWQAAVAARHDAGSSGIEDKSAGSVDFGHT